MGKKRALTYENIKLFKLIFDTLTKTNLKMNVKIILQYYHAYKKY